VSFKKTARKLKNKLNQVMTGGSWRYWDVETKESRESTVQEDYDFALTQRSEREKIWIQNDKYYNNKHIVATEIYNQLEEQGIPWTPAVVPDSYIHVESQIIPDIPDFEFKGRDDDLDSQKAKQREYVVKYVMENNKLESMNTENERRLNILGDAFWKVAWDGNKEGYGFKGDIVIGNPGCENIFPDPAAYTIDDCEYIIYSYRLHRRKASRVFANELSNLDMTIDDIGVDGNQSDTEIYENQVRDVNDDTVQIVEYWFRQNSYDKTTIDSVSYEWEPGDIACSIQINNIEVKYIPKYWIKTGKQNKSYPIVEYCKIPVYNSFWNKSDLEAIKDLQDQIDRELAVAILNDTFTANDIIVAEEGAMVDGSTIDNKPGAIWRMKQGQINGVRRLGGMGNPTNRIVMINFLRDVIQETVGNFDATQGKEPVRVTTASGIAQLNERADARKNIKKADRLAGFERLFELIDWTALEFYDDNRLIFLGAKGQGKEPVTFKYNSDSMRVLDDIEGEYYYPRIDATVSAGDGMKKSKAFTLAATENLISKPINESNYKIVGEMLDIMDTPNKKEIKEYYEALYAPKLELMQLQTQMAIQQIMNPPTPQMQGGEQGQMPTPSMDDLVSGLSPDELDFLEQNPEIMNEIGGNADEMSTM
jgi:hypothetical protein